MSLKFEAIKKNRWLLFDTPGASEVVKWAAFNGVEYEWLYRGTSLWQAEQVSPLLIKLENVTNLDCSSFIHSAVSFETLVEDDIFLSHMRSLVIMTSPEGKPVTIRYYAPHYLKNWLGNVSEERRRLLLGCINSCRWEGNGINLFPDDIPIQSYDFEVNTKLGWFNLNMNEWNLLITSYKSQV